MENVDIHCCLLPGFVWLRIQSHVTSMPPIREDHVPTPTLEEYLEAIYKLSLEGPVRPTQIAESMGVSGPTVTATMRRLEQQGLVTRQGTDVVLTEAGQSQALTIVRKHRVAERFLVDVLGLDWEVAHEDACLLEHALSDRVLVALEALLDNPSVCPHGHPIPTASGVVERPAGRLLSAVPVGESVRIMRVSEADDVLGYLGSVGLVPGQTVSVVSTEKVGDLITVRVNDRDVVIAGSVAARVTVTEA